MDAIPIAQAISRLYRLMEEAAATHMPILIAGERANVVLIAEEDWQAIQETLYLLSVPGMRESIRQGINTSVEEFDTLRSKEAEILE